jgi:hypothetical protein
MRVLDPLFLHRWAIARGAPTVQVFLPAGLKSGLRMRAFYTPALPSMRGCDALPVALHHRESK